MLKLGETGISALYLGDTKIKKAYLGSELVLGEKRASRLPEGYTEVEYIHFTSSSRISTELTIYPQKTKITARVKTIYKTFPYPFIFCARSSTTTAAVVFSMYRNSGTSIGIQAGTSNSVKYVPCTYDGDHLIELNGPDAVAMVDDTQVAVPNVSSSSAKILYIGSTRTNDASAEMDLYDFKVYSSGTLVSDLVPCKNPSGTVGLYDLVRNSFYAGGTSAGPTV